ncbi:hypothetical protein ONE62_20030 [Rhodococcus opacus]|nr:hypothetical protein [Rhodococcus opacus]UZG52477.1 hypothetical protein ONE62_20030 [Rhodococcus opacus]
MAEDSDAAQAHVFLGRLREEIEAVSQNIESAQALVSKAQRAGRRGLTERLRAEVAVLRGELYEAHCPVDALVFRLPAVLAREESAPADLSRARSQRRRGAVPGSCS